MRKLFLFANAFPYGDWEPYLETELPYLTAFDDVHVIALSVRDLQAQNERPVPPGVKVHKIRFRSQLEYALRAPLILGNKYFYTDLWSLIRERKLSLNRLIELVVFLTRMQHEARTTLDYIRRNHLIESGDDVVLYSYRFAYQPLLMEYVAKRLPVNARIVARAHGADLYVERADSGRIPLRKASSQAVDALYLISGHGLNYAQSVLGTPKDKTHLSFLGTKELGLAATPSDGGVLSLYSCANVVPVKRIHLIVQALAKVQDLRVTWTHFGDGPLMDELKNEIAAGLPSNIDVSLRGSVPNAQLLDILKIESFDAMLSVSASEGLPVSMMEAFSFGVPVLSTDVGGVSEIVDDGINGLLIHGDATPDEIAALIQKFAAIPPEGRRELRNAARKKWQDTFNASTNYQRFVTEILEK